MKLTNPELLAPAGTLRKLKYAIAFGADAVYAGLPRYSLRVRNNDFVRNERLAEGIAQVHKQGKKFYLACNLSPHNNKVRTFIKDMEEVITYGPDALIMADPGIIMQVRERWPEVPIHLSVQANTVNYASVKFWQSLGLKRVILSRELSLDEVEEIRQQCPDMELEVFVHGALCIAYSGRCLLSGYFNHRDANQGACTNSCRWEYKVTDAKQAESGNGQQTSVSTMQPEDSLVSSTNNLNTGRHVMAEKSYVLEEKERPGELLPIEEDEHGTYIMNSKDLRAIQHVERLVKIGINSFKIEGRTKSHYYVARIAQIYRQAIDDAIAGRKFNYQLFDNLENLANRGYTDGFFKRHASHEHQNYLESRSSIIQQQFVGELISYNDDTGMAEIDVKNKFSVGNTMELIMPTGNHIFEIKYIEDTDGQAMEEVPGSGYRVRVPLAKGDYTFGLLAKQL